MATRQAHCLTRGRESSSARPGRVTGLRQNTKRIRDPAGPGLEPGKITAGLRKNGPAGLRKMFYNGEPGYGQKRKKDPAGPGCVTQKLRSGYCKRDYGGLRKKKAQASLGGYLRYKMRASTNIAIIKFIKKAVTVNTDDAARALAEALRVNTTLQSLSLSFDHGHISSSVR